MKDKYRILGNMGLALLLVCALMLALVPAAQVEAATAVTNVWVQFTTSTYNKTNTASDFTIHFTPTTALSRGVDKITVWFPDGSTDMGPDNFSLSSAVTTASYYDVDRDGESITYSATDATSAAVLSTTGYRITVTTPVDFSAGVAGSLRVEAAAGVACADSTSHSQYKVKVYTSKDTTPVLSDAFDIDATSPTSAVLALSPDTAGSAGQYTFTLTLATEVAIGGTVTFIFPYGTTVPSSISSDNVRVSTDNGSVYENCTVAPTINQKARMVTITTPVTLDADANNVVRFSTTAGVLNPTTVKLTPFYTDCYVFTSVDELQVAETSGYNVTANTATKIGFNNDSVPATSYSDSATMINMYSSALYVQVQDTYGNANDPATEPTVSFTSSQGSGIFYTNAETDGSGAFTQISSSATTAGLLTVYYRDSVAGTVTLTASASGYTSGTWTMTIAAGVSLYDSNSNLIKTYAPATTATVAETGDGDPQTQKYSSDYVNDAITAAVAGDTVKLGDGIYEVDSDSYINVSKAITLTSVNGAASTTLRNTAEIDKAMEVTITGTAATPITISGLTFLRLRATVDIDCAIRNTTGDYVTVQNCIFNSIIPDEGTAVEAVIWFQAGAQAMTSWTISNNTFTSCVGFNAISGTKSGSIVFDNGGSSYNMTGVTVSSNTLTDCNDYGIAMGAGSYTNKATISNNTITNGYSAIDLADKIHTVSVTGNTITGAYNYGIYLEGTTNTSVTIKSNTITGCAGTNGAIRIEEDTAAAVTVQYNDITGTNSAGYAIRSTGGTTDCKYNWFGNATGPAYTALTGATITRSNPNGTGDTISDKVTYYPWLYVSKATVVTDNASYQASTVKLVSGWNTLSTPVKLIAAADAIDELVPAGLTIGYYYSGGWQQITAGYVLNPCDAVYLKMSAEKYVLLKFDASAFSAPSKSLAAGWNLIGLAYLSSSGKSDLATAASVAKTAANLPGYSQLVSPSLNATQTDMFGTAGTSWAYSYGESATNTCYAGLGYWIYMQNAATLAGFEITPIAPNLN